jgi:hypothetical protein
MRDVLKSRFVSGSSAADVEFGIDHVCNIAGLGRWMGAVLMDISPGATRGDAGNGIDSASLPQMGELATQVEGAFHKFSENVLEELQDDAAFLAASCVEVLFALLGRMPARRAQDWQRIATHTATILADHIGL